MRVETGTGTYVDGRAEAPGGAGAALSSPDAQWITVVSGRTPASDPTGV
ncbi:hypothetical protein ACWEWP_28615 [Streptomyces olivaceus]